jgi:hypothetical protein
MLGPLVGCALGHPDPVQAPTVAPAPKMMSPRPLIVPVVAPSPTVMARTATREPVVAAAPTVMNASESREPHLAPAPTVMGPEAFMSPIARELSAPRVMAPLNTQFTLSSVPSPTIWEAPAVVKAPSIMKVHWGLVTPLALKVRMPVRAMAVAAM